MKISTTSERVETTRKTLVELLMAEHPRPCARHARDHDCELELLGEKYGVVEPIYTPRNYSKGKDTTNFSIAIDHGACILCDRCVRGCTDVATTTSSGGWARATSPPSASTTTSRWATQLRQLRRVHGLLPDRRHHLQAAGSSTELPQGTPLGVEEPKKHPDLSSSRASPATFLELNDGGVGRPRSSRRARSSSAQGEFGSTAFYIDSGTVDIFLETDLAHVRTQAAQPGGFSRR